MKRLIAFLILALAAAHAAALGASSQAARQVGPREKLVERIEEGAPDRYRAAYLLGGLELRAPDADYDRAMGYYRLAIEGNHLPALWLIGKRKLLGGRLGPFEVERDPEAACALLGQIAAAPASPVRAEIRPAGVMVDYGVTRQAARIMARSAERLAAKHCPPGQA